MPKYTNSFKESEYYEHTVVDEGGNLVGTLRVKPVSILWKAPNARSFKALPLKRFIEVAEAEGKSVDR